MKILQVIGDSKYGGATYLILEWCKYLVSRGCKVDVLSTDTRTVEALNHIGGLRVIQDIYIPREISPKEDSAALINRYKLISQQKYDVVHTYTATPGFIGRLAARLSK